MKMSKNFVSGAVAVAALFAVVNATVIRQTCMTSKNIPDSTVSNDFIALHNSYRSNDGSASGKAIPNLVWDDGLAQLAQAWSDFLVANKSMFHGNMKTCNGAGVGQNIFTASSTDQTSLGKPSAAVTTWYGEKANYDYATNTCLKGSCGHYTQVVWAASTSFGCGVTTNYDGTEWYTIMVVCNYYPPGNYVGKKPY